MKNRRIQKWTSTFGSYWETNDYDGVPFGAGTLSTPYYLAFDPYGNLWVSDFGNNRVRTHDNFLYIILPP